jgi:hypothetical protein
MLNTNGYAVTSAILLPDAQLALCTDLFELLFVDLPFVGAAKLLDQAHIAGFPSLVLTPKASDLCAEDIHADATAVRERDQTALLERVKVITARKRGPKPARKPVVFAAEILLADDAQRLAGVA